MHDKTNIPPQKNTLPQVNTIPQISTYVSSIKQAELAVNAGADHLIIEDPLISLRSLSINNDPNEHPNTSDKYSNTSNESSSNTPSKSFSKLFQLMDHINNKYPQITTSINMDLIPHTSHFPLLENFFKLLLEKNSHHKRPIIIRLQDPGLSLFIKKVYPPTILHLITETGNMNYSGVQHYISDQGGSFSGMTFNNELPISDMQNIMNNTPSNIKFELQVHGPLLIQYTQRNLLTLSSLSSPFTKKFNHLKQCSIEEISRPGHLFPILDNNHGTFLYYRADKNLIWFIPELLELELTYWLIDGRGQSEDYLIRAIKYYKQQMNEYLNQIEKKNWRPSKEVINSLVQTSSRPFIRGFFLANNTDKSLRFKQRSFEKRKFISRKPSGKTKQVYLRKKF